MVYTPNPTHTCTHVCTYIHTHMYTYFTVLAIHIQMYAYLRERMTISRGEGGRRRKLLLPLMRRLWKPPSRTSHKGWRTSAMRYDGRYRG